MNFQTLTERDVYRRVANSFANGAGVVSVDYLIVNGRVVKQVVKKAEKWEVKRPVSADQIVELLMGVAPEESE